MNRQVGTIMVTLFLAGACARSADVVENTLSCLPDNAQAIEVKRAPVAPTIGDKSLSDWSPNFSVIEIAAADAPSSQWRSLRGATPTDVDANDFASKVFMARDDAFWYLAFEINDDRRIDSRDPQYPYSGDCLELFFAGSRLSSLRDIHDLVLAGAANQAAFFQLEIPRFDLPEATLHLADFRTDGSFKQRATKDLKVSMWSTGNGWSAETKIPFQAFEDSVQAAIASGVELKFGLDFLDYDERPAQRTEADNWGFKPDNVFCLKPDETYVNIPKCMRLVRFQK